MRITLRLVIALALAATMPFVLGAQPVGSACDLTPTIQPAQEYEEYEEVEQPKEVKCPEKPKKYTISGTVKDGSSGKPVKRVIVRAGSDAKRTSKTGGYRFRFKEGTYTVTPQEDPKCAQDKPPASLPCGQFRPRSRTVVLKGADKGGVDFELLKRDMRVEVKPIPAEVILEELDEGFKPEKVPVEVKVTNLSKGAITAFLPKELTLGVADQDTKPIRQTSGPSPKQFELGAGKSKTGKYNLEVTRPGEFEVEALVLGAAKSGSSRTLRGLGQADLKADTGLKVKARFVQRKEVEGSPGDFVDDLIDSSESEPFDVNLADKPDAENKQLLQLRLTVTNKQSSAVEQVQLDDLAVKWKVEGVKEPAVLPLKQASGPKEGKTIARIDAGESVDRDFVVEVSGDGTYELIGTAKGKGTGAKRGKTLPGKGRAHLHARTPLLFFYSRVDRTVRNPEARALLTAGTAFSVRIRLQNRSYRETLVVQQFQPRLEGNAFGGYIQPANQPIQVAPRDVLDPNAIIRQQGPVVLEPNDGKRGGKDEREIDAVVRTKSSDPTAVGAPPTGGTQARVKFDKPPVDIYKPPATKAKKQLGILERVTDTDKIVFAEGADAHRLSIDDSTPQPPPFEFLGAVAHFTYGAGIGFANSVWGGIRGLFYDLPQLIYQGSYSYVQTIVERHAELWNAIRSEPDLLNAYRAYLEKSAEFALRDLETLKGIGPGVKKLWDQANKDTEKKFTGIANQWYHGNWADAAKDMGEVTGQTLGDIALADLATAKALAIVPRMARAAKIADGAKLAANRTLRVAVDAFTRGRASAKQVIRFLKGKVKPGYIFDFDQLPALYGLSRKQAEYLARLAREEGLIFSLRSRAAESLEWIKKGAYLKPEWIKLKNVNQYDVEFLGFHPDDLGRVVVKENLPDADIVRQRLLDAKADDVTTKEVLDRLNTRLKELEDKPGNIPEMNRWTSSGEEIETKFNWHDNGLDPDDAYSNRKTRAKFKKKFHDPPREGEYILEVNVDGKGYQSVTGDVDFVGITYANGHALSNFDHARVLTILRGPPMFLQHPETATWINKAGEFFFPKKLDELTKDNPLQIAPDGKARQVKYDDAKSCFTSKTEYSIFWEGGYRHIDRKGPLSFLFGSRVADPRNSPSHPGAVSYRAGPPLRAAAANPCANLELAAQPPPGG